MVSRYNPGPCTATMMTTTDSYNHQQLDSFSGGSTHTRGSFGTSGSAGAAYGQTPKERRVSSQLLSKARKNQADKRRNQAACQSIQMPARKNSNENQMIKAVQQHRSSSSRSSCTTSEEASVSSPYSSGGGNRRSYNGGGSHHSRRSYHHHHEGGERACISAPTTSRSTCSRFSSGTTSTRTSTASSRPEHYSTHNAAYYGSSDYDSSSSRRRRSHWDDDHNNNHNSVTISRPHQHAPPQLPQRQLSSSSLASGAYASTDDCTVGTGTVAASLVSDLTEGRSLVGDEEDSLPIWGDHIDDQTAADPVTTIGQRWSSGCDNTTTSGSSSSSSSSSATIKSTSPDQIEIMPGVWQPLRGTQETLGALECSFVVKPSCVACTMHLTCIANAEYVLCPVCRTVSPILGNSSSKNGGNEESECYGVGYGVTDPTVEQYLNR